MIVQALLDHIQLSHSNSDCISLHQIIFKMKPNYVYQALDGNFLLTTMVELLLGRPKCGHGCLIEVYFHILFFGYFRTLITGHLIEGGRLMQV